MWTRGPFTMGVHILYANRRAIHYTITHSALLMSTVQGTEAMWHKQNCPSFETRTCGVKTRLLQLKVDVTSTILHHPRHFKQMIMLLYTTVYTHLLEKFWKVLQYHSKTPASQCKVIPRLRYVNARRLVSLRNNSH